MREVDHCADLLSYELREWIWLRQPPMAQTRRTKHNTDRA